ncbi:hypothetical protein, partial [Ilumatobacter sp.]|uniref:hypothetical protein n=1 Tax=Ilumatobacter sp. TaxID=1967498 RepID=UPI003C458B06
PTSIPTRYHEHVFDTRTLYRIHRFVERDGQGHVVDSKFGPGAVSRTTNPHRGLPGASSNKATIRCHDAD